MTPRVTATLRTFYPDFEAYEIEYSPFGVDSGLCVGVRSHRGGRHQGRACSRVASPPRPVWIIGLLRRRPAIFGSYVPLINGSDTNFSQPFVLTYPANGYPTDKPRPQLYATNLTGFSQGSGQPDRSVNSNQLWGADIGVLP